MVNHKSSGSPQVAGRVHYAWMNIGASLILDTRRGEMNSDRYSPESRYAWFLVVVAPLIMGMGAGGRGQSGCRRIPVFPLQPKKRRFGAIWAGVMLSDHP